MVSPRTKESALSRICTLKHALVVIVLVAADSWEEQPAVLY